MAFVGGTTASVLCTSTGSTFSFTDTGGGTETLTYMDATTSLSGSSGTVGLGTFSFASTGSGSGAPYSGNLTISLTSPAGVTGTFTALFTGNMNGSVGGSTISFSPATETFTSASGGFTISNLSADPVQIGSVNTTYTLTGTLASVPEPVSMGLLGGGLALIGVLRLRSREQNI